VIPPMVDPVDPPGVTSLVTPVITPTAVTAVTAVTAARGRNRVYTTRHTNDPLGHTHLMQNLFNILLQPNNNINFEDVTVFPSNDEIDSASDLLEATEVPEDTICSVCQHHEYRSQDRADGTRQPQWRRLHCEHEFHRPCVDRWFTQSVYCPVCRNDIRNVD
jgi:hypothetical protein